MICKNPFNELVSEFKEIAVKVLDKIGIKISVNDINVQRAPSRFGYLSIPLHEYLRNYGDVEELLRSEFKKIEAKYLSRIEFIKGFLNSDIKVDSYSMLVINSILELKDMYGCSFNLSERYLIEHTSANPIHPLHIGHGRNAVLGDSLARLLKFFNAEVETHFYLDDCGDQVAYAAFGYSKIKDLVLRRIERGVKPDYIIGLIYSATYAIAEIKRLSRELEECRDNERCLEIVKERDEWLSVLNELRSRDEEVIDELIKRLGIYEDITEAVKHLSRSYERGDVEARQLIRELINLVITGFKQTLTRLGIDFDYWDWESEVAIDNGGVDRVVKELSRRASDYVDYVKGALVFKTDQFAKDLDLWNELKLPKYIPKATLTRSDGSSLYLTRDVAYTIWCMENFKPSKIIRVIGVEQTHPQAQLKIILYAMGYRELAKSVVHYAYEMVNIPGIKMSARRGKYVTLDDLINEAKRRVYELIKDREGINYEEVAEAVAVGAIRYTLLSVTPSKTITFTWDRVLNLKQNSGPFIMYTYVRANSILEKSQEDITKINNVPEEVSSEEKELITLLGEYPEILSKAVHDLRIDYITEHIDKIALTFNSMYEKCPVLTASEPHKSFRLALTRAVKIVLENSMKILGIPILKKM